MCSILLKPNFNELFLSHFHPTSCCQPPTHLPQLPSEGSTWHQVLSIFGKAPEGLQSKGEQKSKYLEEASFPPVIPYYFCPSIHESQKQEHDSGSSCAPSTVSDRSKFIVLPSGKTWIIMSCHTGKPSFTSQLHTGLLQQIKPSLQIPGLFPPNCPLATANNSNPHYKSPVADHNMVASLY